MLLLPIFARLGWLKLSAPPFYPLGAALGGYIFGVAMSYAAGCAGGVFYKWGAGSWGAAIAVGGLALGATATELGALRSVRELVQSVGASESIRSATIGDLVGFDGILYVLAPVLAILLLRTRISAPAPTAWTWLKTGTFMGLLATIAWFSSKAAGRDFGLAVVPGTVDLMAAITRDPGSALSWDLFFILAIPFGGYLATRKTARSSNQLTAKSALVLFLGGAVLGVSASLAGGCTVGHSLVGLPLLSLGSIVTTAAMILGTWTVGWFEMKAERKAASTA